MERHYEMIKEFREQEFTKKLKKSKRDSIGRIQGYKD